MALPYVGPCSDSRNGGTRCSLARAAPPPNWLRVHPAAPQDVAPRRRHGGGAWSRGRIRVGARVAVVHSWAANVGVLFAKDERIADLVSDCPSCDLVLLPIQLGSTPLCSWLGPTSPSSSQSLCVCVIVCVCVCVIVCVCVWWCVCVCVCLIF
jgi:hypothetical protein